MALAYARAKVTLDRVHQSVAVLVAKLAKALLFIVVTTYYLHWTRLFLNWMCWRHGALRIVWLTDIFVSLGSQEDNRLENWPGFYWQLNRAATWYKCFYKVQY